MAKVGIKGKRLYPVIYDLFLLTEKLNVGSEIAVVILHAPARPAKMVSQNRERGLQGREMGL